MNPESKDFLKQLVETPSPSGYEHNVQKLVRERIQPWCDSVRTDVMGNVFGRATPRGNRASCSPGIAIRSASSSATSRTKASSTSSRSAESIRWWQLRSASPFRRANGIVPGVIGRKAIHLMDEEDKKKVPKMHDLYIDIGV